MVFWVVVVVVGDSRVTFGVLSFTSALAAVSSLLQKRLPVEFPTSLSLRVANTKDLYTKSVLLFANL